MSLLLALQGIAYVAALSEPLTISEALSSQRAAAVAITETMAVAETIAASAGRRVDVSESTSLAEELGASASRVAALAESLALADALHASVGRSAVVSEGLALAESLASAYAADARIVETVSLSDALASASALRVSVAETVSLAESVRSGAGAPPAGAASLVALADVACAALSPDSSLVAVAADAALAALHDDTASLSLAASAAHVEVLMATYSKVDGDDLPLLTATLSTTAGATNLTGAAVSLRWSIAGATGTVDGTVTDAAAGECTFDCSALPAGRGTGEVRVVFADANVRTYPSAAPFTLVVREAL